MSATPVGGSGRRTVYGRFMEDPQLLRTVTAPGDADVAPATLEAITEYIDTKRRAAFSNGDDKFNERGWAKDNLLQLQVVMDATVTSYDIEVFGTLVGSNLPETNDRWSYVFRQTGFTASQFITLEQVPPGRVKVAVRNVGGSGEVNIYYSVTD